jgi:hypothetical protein
MSRCCHVYNVSVRLGCLPHLNYKLDRSSVRRIILTDRQTSRHTHIYRKQKTENQNLIFQTPKSLNFISKIFLNLFIFFPTQSYSSNFSTSTSLNLSSLLTLNTTNRWLEMRASKQVRRCIVQHLLAIN